MKNVTRKFAIATLAFGVSAAFVPAFANAANASPYQAIVPNNTAGKHGAEKEYEIWLAAHPDTNTSDQNSTAHISHEVVPNNISGPHRARKETDIYDAKQANLPQPDVNSPAIQAQFSQEGQTVLQQVHQARVALAKNDRVTAKKLLHNARATMANMYDEGASGNLVINGQLVMDQDLVVPQDSTGTRVAFNKIIMPFSETLGDLNLAYTQLINSQPQDANKTLGLVERNLSVQSALVTQAPTTAKS
ncbi:hypothetical protein [Thalassospira sp. MCCC 1A01428]|uniref:hypothetical protein n=1 Tax=Thalassospira sp. MCCC 1A01428 TaxID=1470575 RepID=UPI000A1D9EFB|nr:hypothetical protein [Thalassospira sp. MCCC 1A01428]OSQ42102.1 hypothetical protein THS27_15655 [Thalassospira sp. MCCC 1A01428]